MKIINLIFTLLTIFISSTAYAETAKVEFKEDLKPDFQHGRVVLSLANPVLERGQDFQLDVRFTNEEWGGPFFNVFLHNRGAAMPASLAIFDEKKNYLGNLLQWMGGSRQRNTPDDWIRIPAGTYVGMSLSQRAGLFGFRLEPLPAGNYYLQMVYNKSFIAPRPANPEKMLEFYNNFDRTELFRSNTLKVQLVDKKPAN